MKLKPPADASDFKRKFIERAKVLSGRKYAEVYLITPKKGMIKNIEILMGRGR